MFSWTRSQELSLKKTNGNDSRTLSTVHIRTVYVYWFWLQFAVEIKIRLEKQFLKLFESIDTEKLTTRNSAKRLPTNSFYQLSQYYILYSCTLYLNAWDVDVRVVIIMIIISRVYLIMFLSVTRFDKSKKKKT